MVQGHIRGLSQYYSNGIERMEIWIIKKNAKSLPFKENIRVPVQINIDQVTYRGGLRSTCANEYVWISPDLIDNNKQKISLAKVLLKAGFEKNEKVFLTVAGNTINIEHNISNEND